MSVLLFFGGPPPPEWPLTADWATDGEFTVALDATTWAIDADWTTDGTQDVELDPTVWAIDATWDTDGELDVSAGIITELVATWTTDGEFTVSIPAVPGKKRVELVGADGSTLASLPNAVVGAITYRLNAWETWGFTMPVDDPKAHLVTEQRIREAQLWRGDQLLSWGPMIRPSADDKNLVVQGAGARWHLSRRHVGKANRDNQLCNPSFEDGLACWNFMKGKYFLDYAPVGPYDARVYGPGRDGPRALELNIDLQPYVTPVAATSSVPQSHTVVSGDTLWDLAEFFYGSGTEWGRIYDANQAQIQADAIAAGLWNPRDPGHWIFPGQVFTIPGVVTEQVVAAPPDDGTRWGDVFAYQNLVVAGGQRGVTATLVAWVKVPSAQLRGYGPNRMGVLLQRFASNYATSNFWTDNALPNTWGGARAFYTDIIESSSSRLDEGHPLDGWIRHECSITVPPGATEVLHARLCGVQGRTYWDKASLTYDSAFEQFDVDQATIVAELVEHAQDPAFDKNDVNITTDAPATGVERTLVALHSEHGNVWDLVTGYTALRDGLDIGMRYTPTERILTTHYPRKGATRRGLHLQLRRNVAAFTWTFDGEAAASSVIVLGTGDGSDREEAAEIDTTAFADGLILESVVAVGPDTEVDLLAELADEALAVAVNPEVLVVTTYPHDAEHPERDLIGKVWEGDTIPVTIRKGPRTTAGVITGWQFELDDDYRVVELTINPDDSLAMTLNRRAAP
jgi:LysM repeat protein